MKKDKLYFLTFLSLLLIVFVIGYVSMNYLVSLSTEQFLKTQIESSKREAKEMASLISYQINDGIDKDLVVNNIQKSIENTETGTGFICMFDWSGKEICHPNPEKIGRMTEPEESYVSSVNKEINSKDFYSFLKNKEEGGGVRNFNNSDRKSEIIYLYPVKNTDWIIAAHANIDKINEEVESIKINFILVYFTTGSLIILLSLLMVRLIGSVYEKKLEIKNEKLSEEVMSLTKLNNDLISYKTKVEVEQKSIKTKTSEKSFGKKRVLTYLKNEIVSLELEEIAYIFTENTVTYVKDINGRISNSNSSLDELLKDLDKTLFFRANRQFILSLKVIDKILRYGNNQLKIQVQPESQMDIIISKNKASEFKRWLNN